MGTPTLYGHKKVMTAQGVFMRMQMMSAILPV